MTKKDEILKFYKARAEADGQTIDFNNYASLELTEEKKTICANTAFLKLTENAIQSVERVKVDEIQRKVLELLKIKYDLNKNDRYNIATKIEKFKNMPQFERNLTSIQNLTSKYAQLLTESNSALISLREHLSSNN